MKIVIDIPEEEYALCKKEWDTECLDTLMIAVKYGTPLPACHGRLIDADKVRAKFVEYRSKWDAKCLKLQADNDYELGRWESYDFAVDDIDAAPTIIEAEGGE